MDFGIYGGILDMIQITDKTLLHFKLSKSGQILSVDKTCFPRPGHIYTHPHAHIQHGRLASDVCTNTTYELTNG